MITGIFIYLYKTHSFHKKREQRKATINTLYTSHTTDTLLTKLEEQIDLILPKIDNYFVSTLNYCIERKDAQLKKDKYQLLDLVEHTRIVKSTIHQTFSSLPIESLQVGDRYVQAIDYLRKSAVAMQTLTNACLEYVLNEHPHLIDTQQEELKKLSKDFKQLRNSGIELIKNHDFDKVEGFDQKQEAQLEEISRLKIAQL